MKKSTKKIKINNSGVGSTNHETKEIEIFKSRVANAVLDYMEAQHDLELFECLEKASIFLTHISLQIEKVFNNQKQALKDQDDLFEIADDMFSTNEQRSPHTIH